MNVADLRPGVYVRPRHRPSWKRIGVVTFSYFHAWGVARARSVEVTWFDLDGRKVGNYSCRVRDLVLHRP